MMTEDLSVMFDTDELAVGATYDTTDSIAVLFDRAWLEQIGVVSGTEPVALVRATDVDADPSGKTLLVGSTTYKIREGQPVDDGAVMLLRLQVAT